MKIAVQSGLDIVKITEVTSHYVEPDETRVNHPFLVGTDNAVTDWIVTNNSIGADAIQNLPTKGYELLLIGTGDKFTTLTAKDAYLKGKRSNFIKMLTSPLAKFVKAYFIQLGFLDGAAGFQVCRISAYAAFQKYSKLKKLQQGDEL